MTSSVLCVGSILIILGMLLMSVMSIHPTVRTPFWQYLHNIKRRGEYVYHRITISGRQLIGWKALKMKEKADEEGERSPEEVRQHSHHHHYIVHHVDQMSLSSKIPVTAIA